MCWGCSLCDNDLQANYVKKEERHVTGELVQRQMMKLIALLTLREGREVIIFVVTVVKLYSSLHYAVLMEQYIRSVAVGAVGPPPSYSWGPGFRS
jgi:high-affinity Fe2+/Pb2+ permease